MGAKRVVNRLILSLLGGVLIPFCYAITSGPLSTYTENRAIHDLLYVPIGWPKLLLYRLFPIGSFPFSSDMSLLLYMIGCNILFYAIVTYSFLLIRSYRSANKDERLPPPPPSFGNIN